MFEGHVKLYRKFRKSAFYSDSQYVHLWIHLLMSVNWTEKRLKLKNSDRFVTLLPGQILTSRQSLSKETGINISKVERILNALESEQQLEQQTFSKYRVISISKWSEYQSSEQQMNSKRTADEQQMNTKKKVKKEKKEEDKNLMVVSLPEWIPKQAWELYLENRIKIKKPLLPGAYNLAFMKLAKLKEAGHDPEAVLNQSSFSGWQGLFEIKPHGRMDQSNETQDIIARNMQAARDSVERARERGEV